MRRLPSALVINVTKVLLIAGCAAAGAFAQGFSHADSGWVRIFNGRDYTGLYSRLWGNNPVTVPPDSRVFAILYPGTDTACIRVTSTAKADGGNIGTIKTSYSHYRVRVEQKFDALAPTNNGGLTYHGDEGPKRMSNNWPRSVEFQMQQQYAGAAYSIQQVTFTTRAAAKAAGSPWDDKGGVLVNACQFGCDGRWYKSNPVIPNAGPDGKPRWLRFELIARGADSAIHMINDTVVMKLWNIRIFNDTANKTPDGPWDHGAFGLQSEGALIQYRRWEVMEFPAATPKGANYLHRIFLDNPVSGETLKANSTYQIKWRTLGAADLPQVKLEYGAGGAWQTIAASAPNTGTYAWTVPAQVTSKLRVRVSGPAWAWADSSRGDNAITASDAVRSPAAPRAAFSVAGKGRILGDLRGIARVDVHDVTGRLLRSFHVSDRDLQWDLSDGQGRRVPPGLYFVHAAAAQGPAARGSGAAGSGDSVTRVWVF